MTGKLLPFAEKQLMVLAGIPCLSPVQLHVCQPVSRTALFNDLFHVPAHRVQCCAMQHLFVCVCAGTESFWYVEAYLCVYAFLHTFYNMGVFMSHQQEERI